MHKYLKFEKVLNLENLGASTGAHIGTYWRSLKILGWALMLPGVGRAHPAFPSCYANGKCIAIEARRMRKQKNSPLP